MASFLRRNKSSTTASSTASPKRPADQLQHAASSPGPPPQSAIPVAKSPRLSLRSRSSLRAALPMQTGAVVVADEGGPPIEQQQQQQSEGGEQRRKRRTSLKDLFRRSSSSGGGGGASAGPSSPSSSGRAPPSTPPSTGRSAPLDTISSRTSTNGSPLRAAADDSPAGSFRRKRVGSTPGEGEVPLYLRRASQASVSATLTTTPPPGTPSTGYQQEKTTPPQPSFLQADRPRASSIASTTLSGSSAAAPGSDHLASHAEQATTALAGATARGTSVDFGLGRSPSAHALLQQTIAKASPPGSSTASSGTAVRRRSAAAASASTAHSSPFAPLSPSGGRTPASLTATMPDGPPQAPASRRDTFGATLPRPSPTGTPTGLGPVLAAPSAGPSPPATVTGPVEGEMNTAYRFGRPSQAAHPQPQSLSEQTAPASPSRIARPTATSRRETDDTASSSVRHSGSSSAGRLAIPRSAAIEPAESHPVRSPQPGEPTKDSASSAAQAAATTAWWASGPLPPTRAEVAAFPVPPPTPPASSTAEGDVLQRQQRQDEVVPPVRPTPSPTPSFGALESEALRAEAGALDRIADERPTFLDLPHGLRRPAQGADDLFATSPPRALDRALPDEDDEDDVAAVLGLGSGYSSEGDRDELRDAASDLPLISGEVDLWSPTLGGLSEEEAGEGEGPVGTTHALPPTPTFPGLDTGKHSVPSSPSVSSPPSRRTSSYPSPSSTASSVRGGGSDGLAPSALAAVRAPGAASPVPYHLPSRKQSHQYTRSELSELEASSTLSTGGSRPASTTTAAAAAPSIADVFGLGGSASSKPRPTSIVEDQPKGGPSTAADVPVLSTGPSDVDVLIASTSMPEQSETVDLGSGHSQTPSLAEPPLEIVSSIATPSTLSSSAFDDGNASDGLLAPFDSRAPSTSPGASEELSSPVQILEALRLARVQGSPVVSRVSSRAPSPARSTPDRTIGSALEATVDEPRAPSPASPTPEPFQQGLPSNEVEVDVKVPAAPESPPIDPPAPLSFFPSPVPAPTAAEDGGTRPATSTRVRSSRRPPSPTPSSSRSSTPTPPSPLQISTPADRSRPLLSVTSPLPHLVPYAPVPWSLLPAGLRELAEAPELELRREDVVRAADGAARVVGAGLTVAKWGVGWWAIIPYRTGKWALGK